MVIHPDGDGLFWLVEEKASDDATMRVLLSYPYNDEPGESLLVFDSRERAAAVIHHEL